MKLRPCTTIHHMTNQWDNMSKQIVLDHPKGQVFITVGGYNEKLISHVVVKIEALFDVKKTANFEDIFRDFDGLFGKKK